MSGAELPVIAMVAGSAISAGTSLYGASQSAEAQGIQKRAQLMAASEQAAAQEFEARNLDRTATRIRSAAAVDEAGRRDDLMSSLETIQVMRAGRGLDLESPTGRAIMSGVSATAERNIAQSKTNYMLQAANSELAGELARRKARYSLMAGEASAAATDASIDATWAAGIGKAASSAVGAVSGLRYGGTGFGARDG